MDNGFQINRIAKLPWSLRKHHKKEQDRAQTALNLPRWATVLTPTASVPAAYIAIISPASDKDHAQL
jgi:hypothetical protein